MIPVHAAAFLMSVLYGGICHRLAGAVPGLAWLCGVPVTEQEVGNFGRELSAGDNFRHFGECSDYTVFSPPVLRLEQGRGKRCHLGSPHGLFQFADPVTADVRAQCTK